ncbi:MAG: helix-turn-helix transcriptional regulator [bacterium]
MDNILSIINNNPSQITLDIAKKAKELRLYFGLKRSTLAKKAGITEASLKRFELTGKISFESLLKLGFALNCLEEFFNLFPKPSAHSIKELEKQYQTKTRKRGRL